MFVKLASLNHTNDYTNNILYYISGFVAKKLLKSLSCTYCEDLIVSNNSNRNNDHSYFMIDGEKSFTTMLSRGGLINASKDVFIIVKECEKVFKVAEIKNELTNKNMYKILLEAVIRRLTYECGRNLFSEHPINSDFGKPSHSYDLLILICRAFFNLRLHTYGKKLTREKIHKNKSSMRQKLNNLVLFNGM